MIEDPPMMIFGDEPKTNARLECRFFDLRLIREDCLRIVKPGERIAEKLSWLELTPEEYEINESRLAELRALEFRRSPWAAFCAWLLGLGP